MSTWAQAAARAARRIPERTRCEPTGCSQAAQCSMCDTTRKGDVVDASIAFEALGYCPMFLDSRAGKFGQWQKGVA